MEETKKNVLSRLFSKKRVIGVVGNTGTAKSSLVLSKLIELKEVEPSLNIYVYGVEDSLMDYLFRKGIRFIENKEDILDLKIRNSVIFIDEFGDIFSVKSQDKQQERVVRFFNRIDHLNDFVIISTARNGFWNKLMNGFVSQFLVKEIEYDNLINNTPLKRKVKGIYSTSDYRLEVDKSKYYVVSDDLTECHSFEYNSELDSKKKNINPFIQKDEQKSDVKSDVKSEKKDEIKEENEVSYETSYVL